MVVTAVTLRLARTVVAPASGSASAPPLLVLHGVLGSAATYASLLRRRDCAPAAVKIAPDLSGHGRSPHDSKRMTYPAMADDVVRVVADECAANSTVPQVDVCGHSMGGKVAMAMALRDPSSVRKLIVVDIAPVAYRPPSIQNDGGGGKKYPQEADTNVPYIALKAMLAVEREGLAYGAFPSRAHVDSALERYGVVDNAVRMFVCTNLVLGAAKGQWTWRCDVRGILDAMERRDGHGMFGFDPIDERENDQKKRIPSTFDGPTLFVAGGRSRYLKKQRHIDAVYQRFPKARIVTIQHCGHWLQAEDPDRFLQVMNEFLDS